MTTIWAKLPDELINAVMEYWSPKIAIENEQINKLMKLFMSGKCPDSAKEYGFKDPNNYLKKMIEYHSSIPIQYKFKTCIWEYKITKKCLMIKGRFGYRRRLNIQNNLKEYHNTLKIVHSDFVNCIRYLLINRVKNNDKSKYKQYLDDEMYKLLCINTHKNDDYEAIENFNIYNPNYRFID
jgi:hypothetical protein